MSVCKECSHIVVCALFKPGGWVTCPFREKTIDAIAVEIFEEIDNALIENFHADCQMGDCIEDYYDDNLRDDIFKIRKKYLKENKDDNQN